MVSFNTPEELRGLLRKEILNISIEGLISISMVGSFQYSQKFENVNDIDLIILVKKLNPAVFNKINSGFRRIAMKLGSSRFIFTTENRIGPIKPEPIKGKIVIQLHTLLYDIDSWKNKKSATTTFDWVNFSTTMRGSPLSKIYPMKRLGKDDLLVDFDTSLRNLNNLEIFARIYYKENGEIKTTKERIKIPEDYEKESVCYSIIISFLNFLRFQKPLIKKDNDLLLRKGKEILPYEYYSVLRRAIELKEKSREGRKVPKRSISMLKRDAIAFIEYLKKRV